MFDFFQAILLQALPFIPLAIGIAISYNILRATDMTLDGSFVLGAAVFAKCVVSNISPTFACIFAMFAGAIAGMMTAFIQRGGRVDPLLSGILATFILSSINLIIMNKPNIGLLSTPTLLSQAFNVSDLAAIGVLTSLVLLICLPIFLLLKSRYGLRLRAFGDNPTLLKRLGKNIELYRLSGFALTNCLAAYAGCLTAQSIGYADIGMGFGMTLTGIGAIILGHLCVQKFLKVQYFRIGMELVACLLGILLYFISLNFLLRINIDPIYLKMILGILLAIFLRVAVRPSYASSL